MIALLDWLTQDFWHVVGTMVAMSMFGDWTVSMVKAWKGTK